jgi:hypothetical protein
MIIYTRSPYFITVNESGQVGSKIELRIWNGTGAAPTPATYTFSKSIASSTQIENVYNISPFVKEYIDNVAPVYSTAELDSTSIWANVQVKRYKETSVGSYTLLDTTTYLGTNGYTQYLDGYNHTNASNTFMLLSDNAKEIRYDITKSIPYVNILVNRSAFDTLTATYTDLAGLNPTVVTYTSTKGVIKIPLSILNSNYANGNYLKIYNFNFKTRVLADGGTFEAETCLVSAIDHILDTESQYIYKVIPVCEPKYSPVICSYVNRFGGWQFLTFFKAQTNNINVQGSNYNLLQDSINYNVSKGQSKSFNINGKQSVKLSSGFVPENYSDLIQDLLLSETVLLDGKPVEVKTQASTLKTSLQDKNINYEIEFDYAFNLINNVI